MGGEAFLFGNAGKESRRRRVKRDANRRNGWNVERRLRQSMKRSSVERGWRVCSRGWKWGEIVSWYRCFPVPRDFSFAGNKRNPRRWRSMQIRRDSITCRYDWNSYNKTREQLHFAKQWQAALEQSFLTSVHGLIGTSSLRISFPAIIPHRGLLPIKIAKGDIADECAIQFWLNAALKRRGFFLAMRISLVQWRSVAKLEKIELSQNKWRQHLVGILGNWVYRDSVKTKWISRTDDGRSWGTMTKRTLSDDFQRQDDWAIETYALTNQSNVVNALMANVNVS